MAFARVRAPDTGVNRFAARREKSKGIGSGSGWKMIVSMRQLFSRQRLDRVAKAHLRPRSLRCYIATLLAFGQPKFEGQTRCATTVFLVSLFSSLIAKFDSSLTGRSAYLLGSKKMRGKGEKERRGEKRKKRRNKEIDDCAIESRLEWTQVFPVDKSAAVARSKSQLPGLGEAAFPRR